TRATRPGPGGDAPVAAWTGAVRSPRRSCPNPRVEPAVEQVGEEVGEDDAGARDQEAPLQQPEVRDRQRIRGEQAEAGYREHRLDGDGARDHEAEVEGDDRGGRQQGVADGVVVAHLYVTQSLGPSGL